MNMNKVNIKSENQSGGITAGNVNFANQISEVRAAPKRKWSGKVWALLVGIATVVAAIVAVLTYFGFNPK